MQTDPSALDSKDFYTAQKAHAYELAVLQSGEVMSHAGEKRSVAVATGQETCAATQQRSSLLKGKSSHRRSVPDGIRNTQQPNFFNQFLK